MSESEREPTVSSHILAGAIDTHRAFAIFNWAIPIGLVVFAVMRTVRSSAEAGESETVPASSG